MITCTLCNGLTPLEAGPSCLHCDNPLKIPPKWARRLAWVFGPAGAVLLAACYGPSGRYRMNHNQQAYSIDRDGDGARAGRVCADEKSDYARGNCEEEQSYGTPDKPDPRYVDCDDNDPARYPGAADPDGDGIDQNCDGTDGWKDPNVVVQPQNATAEPGAGS